MQQELIINVLGPSSLIALSTITASISQHHCNILDSRHALYGTDFSLTMIVSGTQSEITMLELALSRLCLELDLLCLMKRTTGHKRQDIGQYINLSFSGQDAPGVMQKVSQSISELGVSVHAVRQKSVNIDGNATLKCKMILSAQKDMDLPKFDVHMKSLLNGLNLHGQISHNIKDNDEYIESW